MSSIRFPMRALLTVLLFSLLSCSSDDGGPTEPGETGGAKMGTATITPGSGGTVTATTASGATATLTFPPGAVKTPTDVTIRPLVPKDGDWIAIALEPAGLVFYEYFDIDITLPSGTDLTDPRLFLRPDDPVYLATEVNGRTLSTSLTFFGFTDDSTRSIAGAPPLEQTLSSHGGNTLGAGSINCAQLSATAQAIFDGFVALLDFEEAVEAALIFAAMLDGAGCSQAQTWFDNAEQAVCDGFDAALQDAQSTPTASYGDFVRQVDDIIKWFALAQQYGASCNVAGPYLSTIDAEIADFVQFFDQRIGTLTANDTQTFSDIKNEAVMAFDLHVRAAILGSLDASDKVYDDAFLPAVNQLRPLAYSMCQSDGWHYFVSRLTSTGFFSARDIIGMSSPRTGIVSPAPSQYASFSDEDIFEDLQYCGTAIDIETKVASGGQLDLVTLEGTGPGQKTDTKTVATPTRGKISLDGTLRAFTCWGDIDGDTEIIIALDGTDVLTLRRPIGQGDYFQAGAELIDIGDAAAVAGITPKEGTKHDLTIRRERPNCDNRLWGDASYELITATLEWKNPSLEVEITFPDEVKAGDVVPVDIRVGVIDQTNTTGYFELIDVDLSVAGGAPQQASGQTDSDGYFRTTITVTEPLLASGSSLTAIVTIDATANSFEGVTAEDQHTANVRNEGVATVIAAERRVSCSSKAIFTVDQKLETNDVTGVYDKSFSTTAMATDGDKTGSASADASITSNIMLDGDDYLVEITGSHETSATASAANLIGSQVASGRPSVVLEISFEVTGKPMPFTLEFSGSGSGNYGGYVRFIGVFGDTDIQDPEPVPTISESGMLDPGSYHFRVETTSPAGTQNGSSMGQLSISYRLTLGTPPARTN